MSKFCPMRVRVARARRRGFSILYVVVAFVVLVGFVSLAVDVGRVRLARAQLQTAADAAARSGALSLPKSQQDVEDQSSVAADANGVLDDAQTGSNLGARTNPGVQLVLDEDLEVGIWNTNTRVFTAIEDDRQTDTDERRRGNAVHITGRRIQDRDNPVPLIFAPVVNVFSSDIEREAIAHVKGGPSAFGFIGLDWVDSNGNGANIDSVLPPDLTTRRYNGGVSSDGNINLGNGDVYGDVRPGAGKTVDQQPNSEVTGWMYPLDTANQLHQLYPPVPNNEANGATPITDFKKNKPLVLAGGNSAASPTRYVIDGNLEHPDPLQVNGYVILYVKGDVNIQGNMVINGTPPNPSKLEIRVIGSHNVDVGGTATQYTHVYAPESGVKVHGGVQYYGWIIGKTLKFIGTSNLHYDESNNKSGLYDITLVK